MKIETPKPENGTFASELAKPNSDKIAEIFLRLAQLRSQVRLEGDIKAIARSRKT